MNFDILIALSCGGAGVVCGWVLNALQKAQGDENPSVFDIKDEERHREQEPEASAKVATSAAASAEFTAEKVTEVADRIRSFAQRLMADVDAHQSDLEVAHSRLETNDLSNSPPVIVEVVEQLLAANERMRGQLEQSQQRIRTQSKELETAQQQANLDPLTQIANRGAFDRILTKKHALGPDQAGFLALFDIDHFKNFNDQYGHRTGDEVLRRVATLLETKFLPDGSVARYGGEEFVVLFPAANLQEAAKTVDKARQTIGSRPIHFEGRALTVCASVGIAGLEGDEPEHVWLQRADDALYASKEKGRNRSHYYHDKKLIMVEQQTSRKPKPSHSGDTSGEHHQDYQSDHHQLLPETDRQVTVEAEKDQQVLDDLMSELSAQVHGEPPKSLCYLPDHDAMVGLIAEMLEEPIYAEHAHLLMTVSVSGTPTGATMRSLLQLVRAALRSQDRIGCVNQSSLLVCMGNCGLDEAHQRAENLCASLESIGVHVAGPNSTQTGERVSVGISVFNPDRDVEPDEMDEYASDAMLHSTALAVLAERQETRWPIKPGLNSQPLGV